MGCCRIGCELFYSFRFAECLRYEGLNSNKPLTKLIPNIPKISKVVLVQLEINIKKKGVHVR